MYDFLRPAENYDDSFLTYESDAFINLTRTTRGAGRRIRVESPAWRVRLENQSGDKIRVDHDGAGMDRVSLVQTLRRDQVPMLP